MDFVSVSHLDETQTAQLLDLYRNEWWTRERRPEDVREMLRHTPYLFGICEKDSKRLVAFARVLSDRVYKALVFDVIVHPDFRAHGLGRRLMMEIAAHPDLRRVRHVELYCLPELEPFYERLGFTAEIGGVRLMRRSQTS